MGSPWLSHLSQPDRNVYFWRKLFVPCAISLNARYSSHLATRANQRPFDEPGDLGRSVRGVDDDRITDLSADRTASRPDRCFGRMLAFLCSTPVRRSVLGAARIVGFHPFGIGRQFLLSASGSFTLVQRQHRLSPHPSPQQPNPQLQPARLL